MQKLENGRKKISKFSTQPKKKFAKVKKKAWKEKEERVETKK